jgi:hypothetical protein
LFDFYVQNGIKEVGFNIEEIEGANTRSSLARNGVEAKVRAFIRRFFALVWDTRGLLKVREFESALGHLLADAPVRDEQNSPFAVVSIGHDGTISTFSPELLGARHARILLSVTSPRIGSRTSRTPICSVRSAPRSDAASARANALAAISAGAAAAHRRTSCSRPDASTRPRRCTAG